jgi:hypothetical protein
MPYRGRRLDCYDAGTFCPPAQRYMSSAEAAVPTPIERQREVRLPGIKLTGNAQTVGWRSDSQSAR